MKIAILGYGKQGASAYKYWSSPDNQITICDLDETVELPDDVSSSLGEDYLTSLDEFDLIVRSPSIHPQDIVKANDDGILEKVTTPTNEFFKVSPTKNIIGVTGTKGKGTTSALITDLLKNAGFKAHLGGNFGTSPLDMLGSSIQPDDWVILELANFQLIDFNNRTPIAVCLMVGEEHLNWHADLAEYISSKKQLFVNQTSEDIAIYFEGNKFSSEIAGVSKGIKIPYFTPPGAVVSSNKFSIDNTEICGVDEVSLPGKHNQENICAAITTVWQIKKDQAAYKQALISFKGLPHRLELVREKDGVKYYDDSYGTAPYAVTASIDALAGPKVMIIGGYDKGADLADMASNLFKNQDLISKILLIGASAERVKTELDKAGFSKYEVITSKSIDEIVKRAADSAKSGDSVILAPGFASFDMFKDYEQRGILYQQAVNNL